MDIAGHLLLALGATAVVWLLSGFLIDATDRVAKRYHKPGFAVAFFVLGIFTSISELSVATNATLEHVPQVSAGNLMGASTVIFLLVIPLLAELGGGVAIDGILRPSSIVLLLCVVLLPSLVALDGTVSTLDGLLLIAVYGWLIVHIRKRHSVSEVAKDALERTQRELVHGHRATAMDTLKIAASAVIIFAAGNILVGESVFFAGLLSVPVSFIGLMVLSVGTNIPELVIAIRCVIGRHKDIAFGDYLGSAAFNAPIFGLLPLLNGPFTLDRGEAAVNAVVLAVGLGLFFLFVRSNRSLSRRQSMVLLALYGLFVLLQLGNALNFSHNAKGQDVLKRAAPASLSLRNDPYRHSL